MIFQYLWPREASFPEVHETDELCFVAKDGFDEYFGRQMGQDTY